MKNITELQRPVDIIKCANICIKQSQKDEGKKKKIGTGKIFEDIIHELS